MKARTIVFTLAMCLVGAAICFAQDANLGTWKLNEAKSKLAKGAPKNTTVVYEAVGENTKVTIDGIGSDGKPTHNEWTGKYDGKDYLREEYWSALFGLGTRFGVSALDRDEARRLVVEPVKSKLTFSPESVEWAISATACQPFLLQCLCNRIFDFAAQTKTRSITLDVVIEAGAVLVKDNEHFASLWGYAGSYRRRLI